MAAARSPGFIRSGGVSVNRSWVRSAPDEKTGPLPVITATLTALSSSTSRTASTIALRKPRSIALRLCGRLSRNQAIPTSSTSTSSPRSAHDSTSRAMICLPFVRFDHLASSGPPTVVAAAAPRHCSVDVACGCIRVPAPRIGLTLSSLQPLLLVEAPSNLAILAGFFGRPTLEKSQLDTLLSKGSRARARSGERRF